MLKIYILKLYIQVKLLIDTLFFNDEIYSYSMDPNHELSKDEYEAKIYEIIPKIEEIFVQMQNNFQT